MRFTKILRTDLICMEFSLEFLPSCLLCKIVKIKHVTPNFTCILVQNTSFTWDIRNIKPNKCERKHKWAQYLNSNGSRKHIISSLPPWSSSQRNFIVSYPFTKSFLTSALLKYLAPPLEGRTSPIRTLAAPFPPPHFDIPVPEFSCAITLLPRI
jgi:hypothetical protein